MNVKLAMYFQKPIVSLFCLSVFYCTLAFDEKNNLPNYLYFNLIETRLEASAIHYLRDHNGLSIQLNQAAFSLDAQGISVYLDLLIQYSRQGNSKNVQFALESLVAHFVDQNMSVKQQIAAITPVMSHVFSTLNNPQLLGLYNDFMRRIDRWRSSSIAVVYFLRTSYHIGRLDLFNWSFEKVLQSDYALLAAVDYFDLFFYQRKDVKHALAFLQKNLYQFSTLNAELFLIYLDVLRAAARLNQGLTTDQLAFLTQLVKPIAKEEPTLWVHLIEFYHQLGQEKLQLKALHILSRDDKWADFAYEKIASFYEYQGDYEVALNYYQKIQSEPYLFAARQKMLLLRDIDLLTLSDQINNLRLMYPKKIADHFLFLKAIALQRLGQSYTALDILNGLSEGLSKRPDVLFLKGKVYLDLQEQKKACQFLQQAVDAEKASQRLNLLYESALGECLLLLEQVVSANTQQLITQAYQAKPTNVNYLTNFAWLRFVQNNYNEAIDLLKKARQYTYNEHQQVKVNARLAKALFYVGQKKDGYLVLKKVYDNYPTNRHLLAVMRQLQASFDQ